MGRGSASESASTSSSRGYAAAPAKETETAQASGWPWHAGLPAASTGTCPRRQGAPASSSSDSPSRERLQPELRSPRRLAWGKRPVSPMGPLPRRRGERDGAGRRRQSRHRRLIAAHGGWSSGDTLLPERQGLVPQLVFKTSKAVQPTAGSVRLRRRSVKPASSPRRFPRSGRRKILRGFG